MCSSPGCMNPTVSQIHGKGVLEGVKKRNGWMSIEYVFGNVKGVRIGTRRYVETSSREKNEGLKGGNKECLCEVR